MAAPQIIDVLFLTDLAGESLAQRSVIRRLVLVFDQHVTLNLPGVSVSGAGGVVGSLVLLSTDGTCFVFGFGPDAQVEFGSLKDGNYLLAVATGTATNGDGESNAAFSEEFFRLFGDANGNRTVDTDDQAVIFAANGHAYPDPAFVSFMDFNQDSRINNTDLLAFDHRLGTTLAP